MLERYWSLLYTRARKYSYMYLIVTKAYCQQQIFGAIVQIFQLKNKRLKLMLVVFIPYPQVYLQSARENNFICYKIIFTDIRIRTEV